MRHKELVDKMTLQEKIALCSGKDFWHTKDYDKYGIPSIMMCDGPHGLMKQFLAMNYVDKHAFIQ